MCANLPRILTSLDPVQHSPAGHLVASRTMPDTACTSAYGQCGGDVCPSSIAICSDAAYACCPGGHSCQRLNHSTWQCLPQRADSGGGLAISNMSSHESPRGISAANMYCWRSRESSIGSHCADHPMLPDLQTKVGCTECSHVPEASSCCLQGMVSI